ncbi:MAG: hypothetical protein DRJ01_17285 [Bacteroidetes bacterium]|nr:MAG: hypothetical protein DRJ01_17285 [Bacteroidota bacterium]
MEYKRKIYGYDCDIYGHLNNANYLHIYEEARADALEKMNLSVRELNELGINIYLTHIDLEFIKGIPLEENVIVKTYVSKANRLKSVWRHEIYNHYNELCSVSIVEGVFIKNRKPYRIPSELFHRLQKYIIRSK